MNGSFRHILYFLLVMFLTACENESEVKSVVLSQNALALRIGESVQIEVILSPLSSSSYNTMKWESDDPSVATVDARGVITGVYVGECIVTASAGGKHASCRVAVGTTMIEPVFTQAFAVNRQDIDGSGTDRIGLFLLDSNAVFDTVTMSPRGGTYILLDMETPLGTAGVAAGDYSVSDIPQAYSCTPGSVWRNGDTVALDGSYLVSENDTVLIKGGGFSVAIDEEYNIEGSLDCDGYEIVSLSFAGEIGYYDNGATSVQTESFIYEEAEAKVNGKTADFRYYMTLLAMKSSDGRMMSMNLVSPLSTSGELPSGKYTLTGNAEPFNIVSCAADEGCGAVYVTADGERRRLRSGALEVVYDNGRIVCSGAFIDEAGIAIVCRAND